VIIATFGPGTGWAGKTIAREGDAFILEGHGPISADDVMEYHRQGHLLWANDGTRAWVGSKAQASPARQTGVDAPVVAAAEAVTDQDKVGQALRGLRHSANVRMGVFAGAATLGITWLGTFLLGLIPIRLLGITLLSPASGTDNPFSYHWWAVWSLLGHFGGSVWVELSPNASSTGLSQGSYSVNLTGLLPLAIFVGVMLLVGMYVRDLAPTTVRARLKVVVITAVTIAVLVGLVALLGGYTIGSDGGDYTVGFGVLSSFVRAFVIAFVVGAFAFGVVGLLPVPHAAALQNAARFAIIPALVVALIAPFVVGAKLSDAAGSTNRDFIAVGTLVAPAAGAAIVPMSFGSQATYGVVNADLKGRDILGGGDVGGDTVTAVLKSFSGGRIFELGGRLGTKGTFGAFVLIVAVLAFWVYTVRRYLGVMGAPTAVEGLKAGAFLGLVCAVAVGLLALLLTLRASAAASSLTEDAAGVMSIQAAAGVTGASYPFVLLLLTVTGAGIGYLVGTLRPSPSRYTLSDLARPLAHRVEAALSTRATSADWATTEANRARVAIPPLGALDGEAGYGAAATSAPAAASAPAFCGTCGDRFGAPTSSFCANCGTARVMPVAPMVTQPHAPPGQPVRAPAQPALPTAPQAASSPPATPQADRPVAVQPSQAAHNPPAFCGTCGAPFGAPTARFCADCGAARA